MNRWGTWVVLAVLCLTARAMPARAADAPAPAAAAGADMDYGPFLSGSLDLDPAVSAKHARESTEQTGDHPNNLAAKAVNVRLHAGGVEATVAFDTDLLRYTAGWSGGFVNVSNTHLTTEKGAVPLTPAGKIAFRAPPRMPGWSVGAGSEFKDPRARPFGPLPKTVGRYKGLYRYGERVVFHYTVAGADVLDSPDLVADRKGVAFTRTLRIGPGAAPLSLLVCADDRGTNAFVETDAVKLALRNNAVFIDVRGDRAGETVVHLGVAPHGREAAHDSALQSKPLDLDALVTGGPALWAPAIETAEHRAAASDKPYVVDELTLPQDNPWRAWIRPTGFDFFADGTRAAMCTWNGDVWIVSGIGGDVGGDGQGRKLKWKRFAAGLYEPLGLRVVKDVVHVTGRDQITRLHDLNADGEADFYECFNNDGVASANYHGFAMELQTDAAGNFYYTRCGQRMHPDLPGQGALICVSPDGSKSEPVAAGLRAANGLGVGPNGEITTADNQGNWTPACRINLVKPGGFYGYMPHARAAGGPPRTDYDPPLCWLPMSLDSSSGSQAWVPPGEKRWGPLAGRMLHTSYGTASLMLVLTDASDGTPQAGVVRFPLSFASGVMRARFNPADGQLYLCGLKAWQSRGARDGTFCRVRYTGRPVAMPWGLRVLPAGVELTFTQPLDPDTANDPDSFGVERWNYRWTEAYGSPEFSAAADPAKQGRDEVAVKSAKLRDDGRTVFLELDDFKPVMQMSIRYDLDTKPDQGAAATMSDTIYLTINRVPER